MTAAMRSSGSPCSAFAASCTATRAFKLCLIPQFSAAGQMAMKRVTVSNPFGEKLVGVFGDKGSQGTMCFAMASGGNVVLLYASKYRDVSTIANLSGRFNLQGGIKKRLGERALELVEKQGFVEIKDRNGDLEYTMTEESFRDRLNTDMKLAVLAIPENFR